MKLNNKQRSLKFVLNKVLALPFINNVNLGRCVELTGEFINSIGHPKLYDYYIGEVVIENYQGDLPLNFKNIEAIRNAKTKVNQYSSFGKYELNSNNFEFKIQDNIIHTHIKEGVLDILFQGYKLDEEGFPTIPDNEQFIKALYWYIAHDYAFEQFLRDELSEAKYRKIEQEHLHYMGSARYESFVPDKLEMQNIINQQLQVVPDMNMYKNGFLNSANITNYNLYNA